jgi:hypothetical protein
LRRCIAHPISWADGQARPQAVNNLQGKVPIKEEFTMATKKKAAKKAAKKKKH